jgi:hypothetical protein
MGLINRLVAYGKQLLLVEEVELLTVFYSEFRLKTVLS